MEFDFKPTGKKSDTLKKWKKQRRIAAGAFAVIVLLNWLWHGADTDELWLYVAFIVCVTLNMLKERRYDRWYR